jgi:regulator of replication initiation timing
MKASGHSMNSEQEMLRIEHNRLRRRIKRLAMSKKHGKGDMEHMKKVAAAIDAVIQFEREHRGQL